MWAGIAAWFVTSVAYPHLPGDLIGFVVSLVTMVLITPLTQTFDPPRKLVDHAGNEVDLSNRLGTLR